jgi:hypothetical protein
MTARSVRLLPFALACLLTALAWPAQSGTADAPEVVDDPGDARLPPLDIAAAWFETNGTDLIVHVERGEGADTAPAIVRCQDGTCVGAGVSLRVVFTVLKPDGTNAPSLADYASSYVLVRLGPDDPDLAAAVGYYDSAGAGTIVSPANVTVDGGSIVVNVPRSSEALALPDGPTPGAYRITQPYALSYILTCDPAQGCGSRSYPDANLASAWDRAPDTDFGMDFVFPSPPPAPPVQAASAATTTAPVSTTTVTVVQTTTRTTTVTQEITVTSTPLPIHVEAKGAPSLGLVLVALALCGSLVLRRRLP